MTAQPIRLAIVNDYEIVVVGVAGVLAPFAARIEVVELDSRTPVVSDVDIVLYDTFGQVQGGDIDVDGLMADTSARLVVFSWNTEPDVVASALQAGAAGYLSKGLDGEGLVSNLERVHAGETVTPESVPMPEGAEFGRWPGDDAGLSPREAEILALICQGMSNKEVVGQIFIGMNTLKTHIRSLYRKIGVDSRTRALLWGIDHGFRPDRSRIIEDQPGR